MTYSTIVADPPWPYEKTSPSNPRCAKCGRIKYGYERLRCRCDEPALRDNDYKLPYGTMTVADVAALPIGRFADAAAHLYLWTTQRFLRDAFNVVDAWGFRYSATLVWAKSPKGLGGTFVCSTEFCLFARRGSLAARKRHMGTCFHWPRGAHSAKPDAFLDVVESVSPGPYLELFARRARFGWDYWGDESLGTAEMPENGGGGAAAVPSPATPHAREAPPP